jgi:ABC-type branched-subunit amino acid transport system ATPase component
MKPFFEARQLTYQHQRGPLAVRGVSLEVARASMTAVIGANGSGKIHADPHARRAAAFGLGRDPLG